MIFQFSKQLMLATFLFASLCAQAYQSYQTVGKGQMSWLFFDLYQARLLSPVGYYRTGAWPIALELTYQRNIKKSDLIKATVSEWQRMQVDYSPDWINQLTRLWPDVSKDDVLLFHVDAKGVGHFYFNDQLLGSLKDTNFCRAFLMIWLSEKAHNQSLRRQLLGL